MGVFPLTPLNYETGTACHCRHQPISLGVVSSFFWMKQNNNSAGQLIALLFSINLHYCRTQELPLCQRRDSIKRLPEQTYLPCIPKSDTFGSIKHQRGFFRWSPSPWNVSPPFLQSFHEEYTAEVSFTALMNHSSLILYLDRDHEDRGFHYRW